jgi:outer membrane protein assembly factor BamB
MFQGNAAHTGRSPFTLPTRWPMELWKTLLNGPGGYGEHSIGMSIGLDGTVYVAAYGALFAVDPADGHILWDYPVTHSRSTPAVGADGYIYWGHDFYFSILTPGGELVGEWQGLSPYNSVFGGSPVIAPDGSIYVGKDGGWHFWPDSGAYHYDPPIYCHYGCSDHPAIAPDGTIYLNRGGGTFSALEPGGTITWTRPIGIQSAVSIAPDGTLYGGGAGGTVLARSATGNAVWDFDIGDSLAGSVDYPPAIGSDGTLYFGSAYVGGFVQKSHVYAVHPDGTLKWKREILPIRDPSQPFNGGFGVWAPIVVDREDRVLACVETGQCYAFNSAGDLLWTQTVIKALGFGVRTAPLITQDGLVLILDRDGYLHAITEAASQIYLPGVMR